MAASQVVVLVTGANVGVGFHIAKVLASASPKYHVIMTGRSAEKLEAAHQSLVTEGGMKGSLSTIHLDVTNDATIDEAVKQVDEQFGRLDVLVNNAAFIPRSGTTREQLLAIMDTNVAGPIVVAEKFNHLLLRSKNAYSIFISSGLGSLGFASDPTSPHSFAAAVPYRASKAALNMLVIQEHRYKKEKGIKVFAMCPGLVRSNLRGTSEEQQSAGGRASNPIVSGQTVLSIIDGKRDADVGKFINKDGIYPW